MVLRGRAELALVHQKVTSWLRLVYESPHFAGESQNMTDNHERKGLR